ncbi:MAG: cysteine desulfurase family protein [Candidatus Sumerlaeia bacterium]|nr:cysteine desulfurase family protein [Candidatus Sumerlaeia bacterium]
MKPIFLDNNSTTQLHPEVLEAMFPWLGTPCNPSSFHESGAAAKKAVEEARGKIANLLGCYPEEILFTSGATEANNLALTASLRRTTSKHFLSTILEHKSVLEPLKRYQSNGFEVTLLESDSKGAISTSRFQEVITTQPRLVSILHSNNETGVINPLEDLVDYLNPVSLTLFHTDATQSIGKIPLNLKELPVDLLTLSAHKFHGPMGIGALYVRRRSPTIQLEPLQVGGGQEKGRRSGTLNTPAIVGMGKAAELAQLQLQKNQPLKFLRDRLESALLQAIPGSETNGDKHNRLPNTFNLYLPGVLGSALMQQVPDVCFSTGSACSSAQPEPSHVLLSMFRSLGEDAAQDRARCSIRFAVSQFTTQQEVDTAAQKIINAALQLREA